MKTLFPKSKEKKHRISLTLPESVHEMLEELAEQKNSTVSGVATTILRAEINKYLK